MPTVTQLGTAPLVHLNGTSGEDLIRGYEKATYALRLALTGLVATAPNARDYVHHQAGEFRKATQEFEERYNKVHQVYTEIEALREAVEEQV